MPLGQHGIRYRLLGNRLRLNFKNAQLRPVGRGVRLAQRPFGQPWTRLARGNQFARKFDQLCRNRLRGNNSSLFKRVDDLGDQRTTCLRMARFRPFPVVLTSLCTGAGARHHSDRL